MRSRSRANVASGAGERLGKFRMAAIGGDDGEITRLGLRPGRRVGHPGLPDLVRDVVGDDGGEHAEHLQPRAAVQPGGPQGGQGVLHEVQRVRAEGPAHGQCGGQPGMPEHMGALEVGDALQIRAPVAGEAAGRREFAADVIDHQLHQRVLVGCVGVEGHDAYARNPGTGEPATDATGLAPVRITPHTGSALTFPGAPGHDRCPRPPPRLTRGAGCPHHCLNNLKDPGL